MTDSSFAENSKKIEELDKDIQWAFVAWMNKSFGLNMPFRIIEAFRSQKRQDELYKIGRSGIASEKPVTWTLHSMHTQRKAVDIVPLYKIEDLRHWYEQQAEIAREFRIYRPQELVALGDIGHFDGTMVESPKMHLSTKALLEQAEKRLLRIKEPERSRLAARIKTARSS